MIELEPLTIKEIRSYDPCYDPSKYLPKEWAGTLLDLLLRDEIPLEDILWVYSRRPPSNLDPILRRFAAWCAAEALFITQHKNKRSWAAVEAAIQHSLGKINDAARAAARDAAKDAAKDAARAAARAAAWAAAGPAAGAAAWAAAGAAAWAAAGPAARAAAGAAAWAAQRRKLLAMIREESDFTLSDLLNNYPIERE